MGVSFGARVSVSEHFLRSFLQQTGAAFFGAEAFRINILTTSKAAIKPKLIQFFLCMVVVLGWDEIIKGNVTVFLLFILNHGFDGFW